MNKTLSVSAIKTGTVIDHVPAGQAIAIVKLLRALADKHQVTLGLNLPSKRLHLKDLIKIENKLLSEAEASQITIFAPKATINIIENFEVTKKIPAQLPEKVMGIFNCPNPACITSTETVDSCFYVEDSSKGIKLICKYCEKQFDREQVK